MKKWGLILLGTWILSGIIIGSYGEEEAPDAVMAILGTLLLTTLIIFIVKAIGAWVHKTNEPNTKKNKPAKAEIKKKTAAQKQQKPVIIVQNKEYHPAAVLFALGVIACAFIFSPSSKNEEKPKPEKDIVEQKTETTPKFIENGKLIMQIPVCQRASDFDEYSRAIADKDYETTKIYEKRHLCFMLKSGVKVSVLESHLFKPTKIRAYKDGDMIDLYTSISYVLDAE